MRNAGSALQGFLPGFLMPGLDGGWRKGPSPCQVSDFWGVLRVNRTEREG